MDPSLQQIYILAAAREPIWEIINSIYESCVFYIESICLFFQQMYLYK